MEKTIVNNTSDGYGYKYASLADIATQGFNIPKMKTGTENSKEYIYWFDDELKEWLRGAEIVIPSSKGMNAAQLYGSALTYARRQTVLMADRLATKDDEQIEKQIFDEPVTLKDKVNEFKRLYSAEEASRIMNGLKVTKIEDIGSEYLDKYINFKKYGSKQNAE